MPIQTSFMDYDRFLMSGMFYMSSVARESEGIILTDFKGNNAFDIVAYNIAYNYANLKDKAIYLKTNFFRFLWFKFKYKSKAKWCHKIRNNYLSITPSKILTDIAEKEELTINIVYNIYDEYYNLSKLKG